MGVANNCHSISLRKSICVFFQIKFVLISSWRPVAVPVIHGFSERSDCGGKKIETGGLPVIAYTIIMRETCICVVARTPAASWAATSITISIPQTPFATTEWTSVRDLGYCFAGICRKE